MDLFNMESKTDFRKLLKRYIEHVGMQSGAYWIGAAYQGDLSEEEEETINKLIKENYGQN